MFDSRYVYIIHTDEEEVEVLEARPREKQLAHPSLAYIYTCTVLDIITIYGRRLLLLLLLISYIAAEWRPDRVCYIAVEEKERRKRRMEHTQQLLRQQGKMDGGYEREKKLIMGALFSNDFGVYPVRLQACVRHGKFLGKVCCCLYFSFIIGKRLWGLGLLSTRCRKLFELLK